MVWLADQRDIEHGDRDGHPDDQTSDHAGDDRHFYHFFRSIFCLLKLIHTDVFPNRMPPTQAVLKQRISSPR